MAIHIFSGNTIAVIWDFDQTLIPGYQQAPLFEQYGIDPTVFWKEVNALPEHYNNEQGIVVSPDTAYLGHLLQYVAEGRMPGLTNTRLREFGAKLTFYEGMPEFLKRSKDVIENEPSFQRHGINVEHYIVSTGLRQVILGSKIAQFVDGVWASEFIERVAQSGFTPSRAIVTRDADKGVISQIGYFLDNTTKTRAIWEINKGTNKDNSVDVNSRIAESDRRVPIPRMLYVADGPSDIPVFSILNQYGGKTLGVYNGDSEEHFRGVKSLSDQGRVQAIAEADYSDHSLASRWILESLSEIARLIVRDRDRLVSDSVGRPTGHVT